MKLKNINKITTLYRTHSPNAIITKYTVKSIYLHKNKKGVSFICDNPLGQTEERRITAEIKKDEFILANNFHYTKMDAYKKLYKYLHILDKTYDIELQSRRNNVIKIIQEKFPELMI